MANRQIKYTIIAVDKFTAVGRAIARVNRSIDASLRKVNKSLKDQSAKLKKAGQAMRSYGSKIKSAAGELAALSAASGAAVLGSIKLASNQEKAEILVAKALERQGTAASFTKQQLFDMAAGLQKVSTFGDEDILQNVTRGLLRFDKIQGETFTRTQQLIVDMAAAGKGDLAGLTEQIGQAFQSGNVGGLLSFISSPAIKKQIQNLQRVGKAYGAQQIALRELTRLYSGEALAATKTFEGQILQLKNELFDGAETLGATLIPVIRDTLIPAVRSAVEWFKALSPSTKKFIAVTLILTAALAPLLLGVGAIVQVLGVAAIASGVTLGAVAALAGTVGVAIVAFAAWGVALSALADFDWSYLWEGIKNLGSAVWTYIVGAFNSAVGKVKEFIGYLTSLITGPLAKLGEVLGFDVSGDVTSSFNGNININVNDPGKVVNEITTSSSGSGPRLNMGQAFAS